MERKKTDFIRETSKRVISRLAEGKEKISGLFQSRMEGEGC